MNRLSGFARVAIIIFISLPAAGYADSIILSGPGTVTVGNSYQLDVIGDFSTDGLLAGGVVVGFDPSLVSIDSVTIPPDSAHFETDALLTCPGTCHGLTGPDEVQIAWGELSNVIDVGAPPQLMATLTVTALAAGNATITMVQDPNNPLVTATTFSVGTASVHGTVVSAVPVPAAIWLLGSGLLVLAGVARQNTNASLTILPAR